VPVDVVVDLRGQFGLSRDQGQRPTCMSFAASDAHAAARGDVTPLSCEYAHFHAIRRSGANPDSGVSLPLMSKTIEADGQPIESGWPYLVKIPSDPKLWRPPAVVGPISKRASTLMVPSLGEIIRQLDVGKPVILTTQISISFYRPDADGVIDGKLNEPRTACHAVVAVGHGTRKATQLILVRNSWGPTWGLNGYGWVTARYISPRLYHMAIIK
jgi:Papain family cysteine protease